MKKCFSFLLTLLVLPILYELSHRRAAAREREEQ